MGGGVRAAPCGSAERPTPAWDTRGGLFGSEMGGEGRTGRRCGAEWGDDRLAAFNARTIAEEPPRDPAAFGALVVQASQDFLAASAGRSPDEGVPM